MFIITISWKGYSSPNHWLQKETEANHLTSDSIVDFPITTRKEKITNSKQTRNQEVIRKDIF